MLYPVVDPGATATTSSAAYIMWNPIFNTSVGSKIRTYSGFVNDAWRFNDRFTFNLGVRFDKSDAKDQAGLKVVDDQVWSPRLAATWSPNGERRLDGEHRLGPVRDGRDEQHRGHRLGGGPPVHLPLRLQGPGDQPGRERGEPGLRRTTR